MESDQSNEFFEDDERSWDGQDKNGLIAAVVGMAAVGAGAGALLATSSSPAEKNTEDDGGPKANDRALSFENLVQDPISE